MKMRLSTLARKVNKTPTQLIVFLSEQGIEITNGLHSKLEKDVVNVVLKKYQPEQLEETNMDTEPESLIEEADVAPTETKEIKPEPVLEEKPEVEELPKVEPPTEILEVEIEEIFTEEIEEITLEESKKAGTVDDLEGGESDNIEHIKAKKIKLEGIKVVGKIELPEKPKKASEIHESEVTESEDQVDASSEKQTKSKTREKQHRNERKRHNNRGKSRQPLSFEEKLKQEERNKRREKQKKAREEKRRKQKFYQENIQPKHAPKTQKKKKKSVSHQNNKPKETIAPHKNPIKRLWDWLNGKYDKY